MRNLVLVADGKGSGVLLGSIVMLPLGTDAPQDANPPGDVFEAAEGEGAQVDFDAPVLLPPVSRVTLGVDDDQVPAVVEDLEATPGQVVPVSLLFRDAGEVTLDVVVVDNEDGPYEGISPRRRSVVPVRCRRLAPPRARLVLELVAQPPHGEQVGRVRGVGLDLGPQPLDVDVERLGVADVVAAPHPVDELHPGEHPARSCAAAARAGRTP